MWKLFHWLWGNKEEVAELPPPKEPAIDLTYNDHLHKVMAWVASKRNLNNIVMLKGHPFIEVTINKEGTEQAELVARSSDKDYYDFIVRSYNPYFAIPEELIPQTEEDVQAVSEEWMADYNFVANTAEDILQITWQLNDVGDQCWPNYDPRFYVSGRRLRIGLHEIEDWQNMGLGGPICGYMKNKEGSLVAEYFIPDNKKCYTTSSFCEKIVRAIGLVDKMPKWMYSADVILDRARMVVKYFETKDIQSSSVEAIREALVQKENKDESHSGRWT